MMKEPMKQKTVVILVILLLGLLAGFLSPVSAQNVQPTPQGSQPTPSDNDVNAVAKQMFCPVCENIPLDVCPTTACQEWRELIRLKLSEGWTDEQIKDYFAVQYGDRVLAEPPRRGLNWLVYVVPPIFILFGALLVANVLRTMRRPVNDQVSTVVPTESNTGGKNDDPYLEQLEEELRKKPE
jgi:cytochrome c-type biogenesis protein CcmH